MATCSTPAVVGRGITYRVCWTLCELFNKPPLKRFSLRAHAVGGRFDSRANYLADRVANAEDYRMEFRNFADFRNKTVLELGCSSGYLLDAFLQQEAFTAIGADIDAGCIQRGRRQYGKRIRFIQSTAVSVPLPDNSVDIIYCVDTVEHLSKPREMLMDCFRVLRPGGRFLIHWHPWLGPYGSHLEDTIPFPWAHAIFPMGTLLDVAADLYDSPGYESACYWYDHETGQRRPNPYRDHGRWEEFLNKMTIRGFRRLLRLLPYQVLMFRKTGFGGKAYKSAKLLRGLAHIPPFDEFFLKAVVCVLEKPHRISTGQDKERKEHSTATVGPTV